MTLCPKYEKNQEKPPVAQSMLGHGPMKEIDHCLRLVLKVWSFLKSLSMKRAKKDAQYFCNFISSAIENIGPLNVVQFVSDNALNYPAVGEKLVKYSNIFKIKCASHCINLMVKEFDTIEYVSSFLKSVLNCEIHVPLPTCFGFGPDSTGES